MSRNARPPKKPGPFPPFALFSQENRDRVLQEHKDISFTDVGKKMGELWHGLTESEKEDYRRRAREIGEQKLKEWHEKMKQFPPHLASQYKAAAALTQQKRRRTHGYAIFSSEMRKKITENVSAPEMTKIIAEHWRNASQTVRQQYEAKAARINEIEAKKYQQLVLQNQRRLQLLQQQKQKQLLAQRQMPKLSPAATGSGLRISSVASLATSGKAQSQPSRGVNLPSSITISRVESESPKFLPGMSLQRIRGPPPLTRGGIPAQRQQQQLRIAARPNLTSMRPTVLKRPLMGAVPSVRPSRSSQAPQGSQAGLITSARLCRLCGQNGPYNFLLKDKPEAAEAIKFVLGIDLDDEDDKNQGYPETICRKCTTVLTTYSQFKKSVESGQSRLKAISEEKRRRLEEQQSSSLMSAGHDDKSDRQTKAESYEDELEKQQIAEAQKENGTKKEGTADENVLAEDDDDEAIDPLMFIQVSQEEGNYSDFEDAPETDAENHQVDDHHEDEATTPKEHPDGDEDHLDANGDEDDQVGEEADELMHDGEESSNADQEDLEESEVQSYDEHDDFDNDAVEVGEDDDSIEIPDEEYDDVMGDEEDVETFEDAAESFEDTHTDNEHLNLHSALADSDGDDD